MHPMYRRPRPKPQKLGDFASDTTRIDLRNAHLEPYGESNTVAKAIELFDARAAAAIRTAVGDPAQVGVFATDHPEDPNKALLETKLVGEEEREIHIPRVKSLAAMAFPEFFPDANAGVLRDLVSKAILAASPGWCGTFGPRMQGVLDLLFDEETGDYDMSQMHLLQIAYRYYDELTPDAREHLIGVLLAQGQVMRPQIGTSLTSGRNPEDWSRAGFISLVIPLPFPVVVHDRIGETENHILMILTARYLTNQLLYQRDRNPIFDNRRNGTEWVDGEPERLGPDCTGLLLILLRWMLMNDFSEYNAKPYQTQTRFALLNLCSYAYDHEVRLAARMVLDYISAHIAVSSSDLRRMVPFRRRNEKENVTQFDVTPFSGRYMDIGLLEWFLGADRSPQHFAIQAGNTRAYETKWLHRGWEWGIASDGSEAVMEALSGYRLPPSIHHLFVNDSHRRFFQRLHRVAQPDFELTGRNCNNLEVYAGSPSYLISAGGANATYAIDPGRAPKSKVRQQLGVAVTTSFMPTGLSAGPGTQNRAKDVIQFSSFSDGVDEDGYMMFPVENYGVAPDFACGHQVYLPGWVVDATLLQAVRRLRDVGILPTAGPVKVRDLMRHFKDRESFEPFPRGSVRSTLYRMRELMAERLEPDGKFVFVNRGPAVPGKTIPAGFYLAIYRDPNRHFALLEAFDTWRDPTVSFETFKRDVEARSERVNKEALTFQNRIERQYTTRNGNTVHFMIWRDIEVQETVMFGATITKIDYGEGDRKDTLRDAGNDVNPFLSGTIMNSSVEAIVEITNPFLGTKITLDMSDPLHPKRTSENGEVEEAGSNHEVWVDFASTGPGEGDFFRPLNTLAAATTAVADGGVIRIMPGSTHERDAIPRNKRMRLVAPIGGVTIGAR